MKRFKPKILKKSEDTKKEKLPKKVDMIKKQKSYLDTVYFVVVVVVIF